jgi:hypothetical protein
LILSACGCEDYDDILQDAVDIDDDDDEDEEEEEEEGDDTNGNSSSGKIESLSTLDTIDREQEGGGRTKEPVLKMGVMLKKLHLDPGSFSSLIDSLKTFIKSSPSSSERTILSCYVADRYGIAVLFCAVKCCSELWCGVL